MSNASHTHRDRALHLFLVGWAKADQRKKKAIGMMLSGQYRMREVVAECGVARSTLQDWWSKFQSDVRSSARAIEAETKDQTGSQTREQTRREARREREE